MSEATLQKPHDILANAKSLCTDFADKHPIDQILSNFTFTNQGADIVCYEYGARHQSVPFLGREFRGLDGARAYFELLSQLLSYDKMIFSEYIVDNDNMAVSVRGEATFTWLSTKQSWDEVFTYRLKFDKVDGKIVKYEVWADSLSAYLASTGQYCSRRDRLGLFIGANAYGQTSDYSGSLKRTHGKKMIALDLPSSFVTLWESLISAKNVNSITNTAVIFIESCISKSTTNFQVMNITTTSIYTFKVWLKNDYLSV